MMNKVEVVSVLMYPAEDIPGVWIAHCLDLDVMSQGMPNGGVESASECMAEAIMLACQWDRNQLLDPFRCRKPAPAEDWDAFTRTAFYGVTFDNIKDPTKIYKVATHFKITYGSEPDPKVVELPVRSCTAPGHN
jgi:hypothetical protein